MNQVLHSTLTACDFCEGIPRDQCTTTSGFLANAKGALLVGTALHLHTFLWEKSVVFILKGTRLRNNEPQKRWSSLDFEPFEPDVTCAQGLLFSFFAIDKGLLVQKGSLFTQVPLGKACSFHSKGYETCQRDEEIEEDLKKQRVKYLKFMS